MPRAKVRPEARQRVAQACQQCKASKRKCNASLPCDQCIKRGTPDACETLEGGATRRQSTSTRSQAGRQRSPSIRDHQSITESLGVNHEAVDVLPTNPSPPLSHNISLDNRNDSFQPSSPDTTRANMLSNNAGEYVFVGRSASLSFLQLVRETVARCIGPSEFSEHVSRNHMLEIDLEFNPGIDTEVSLDQAQCQRCVEHYFLVTRGMLDVITPEEALKLLGHRSSYKSYLAAVRLLIIAIGMQAGPRATADATDIERRAFAQSRAMMFTSMLEDPSLDMIRAFLLLAFYMLGACRRNAAFIYLGIAARAAHALGLHTVESYAVLNEDKRHVQLKCWKSLVTLDLMVTSVLGRTTAILAQRSSSDTVVKITAYTANNASIELEAVYRLALVVDSISSQFNGQEPITVEMAQTHLQHLKAWSSMLPASLRPSTIPEDNSSTTRQSLIGCMHISCFYYFAVMLVTRPFLIIHVTRTLFRKSSHQLTVNEREEAEELASACLNAAVYMAQTCANLLDYNLLAENMCLLKAWIFAAALVLGFEMFADSGLVREADQAFHSCCRVLQRLAVRSPLALQYHEILILFSASIEKYQRMRKSRKSQGSGSFVTRIMDLPLHDSLYVPPAREQSNGTTQSSSFDALQPTPLNKSLTDPTQFFGGNNEDFTAVQDNFQIPSPDSFLFDLQSFGMMPWGPS